MRIHERALLPALLVMMMAVGPISTDLFLPALPEIRRAFATDTATVQLTLSLYMAVFAVCQLFYGPLSDRYGRRPVLLAGLGLYVAGSVLCFLASGIGLLVAARMVQALGGCACVVIARAVVRDAYGPTRAARLMSQLMSVMALAPILGPVLGGYLTAGFGWRANFASLLLFGLLLLLAVWLLLQETNSRLNPSATRLRPMLQNFAALLRHRGYRGYMLAATFVFSGVFAFISGSSYVFIQMLGLSAEQYGYCFAAAACGYLAGAQTGARLVGRTGIQQLVLRGGGLAALGGSAMLLAVLADAAGIFTILLPMIVYMFGMALVLPNSIAAILGPFPRIAGSASSLAGAIQTSTAALTGMAVGAAFNGTALPMAAAIALCGLLCGLTCWLVIRKLPDPAPEDAIAPASPPPV